MRDAALIKTLMILAEFSKLDPEMSVRMASVFVRVAENPGITMKELAEREGMSQSSCSRNIAALSKWHRLNKPGLDLVYASEDPVERRRKVAYLTPKGKKVAETLGVILGDETGTV